MMSEFQTKLPLGENELTVEPGTKLLIKRLVYKCPWCNFTHISHPGFYVVATEEYKRSPAGNVVRMFALLDQESACHCRVAAVWISTDPPMLWSHLEELDIEDKLNSAPLCA